MPPVHHTAECFCVCLNVERARKTPFGIHMFSEDSIPPAAVNAAAFAECTSHMLVIFCVSVCLYPTCKRTKKNTIRVEGRADDASSRLPLAQIQSERIVGNVDDRCRDRRHVVVNDKTT